MICVPVKTRMQSTTVAIDYQICVQ